MPEPAAPRAYRVTRPGTTIRRPDEFAKGRSCPECDTVLSRYNQGPFCTAHERYNPITFGRVKGEGRARRQD